MTPTPEFVDDYVHGYPADHYLKLVSHFKKEPTTYGPGRADFSDSDIETACKGLEVAAAALAIGGCFFPPLELVAGAVGIAASIVRWFDKQDKMQELLDKITDSIDRYGVAMESGFDNLEKVISESDFHTKVVSPSRELYAAFKRCVLNGTQADLEEFIELFKSRHIGGLKLVIAMKEKLDINFEGNFFKKGLVSAHFAEKNYAPYYNYVTKALFDLVVAQTFYLVITNDNESKEETKWFMKHVNDVRKELEIIKEWQETAYFNKTTIRKVVDDRIKDISWDHDKYYITESIKDVCSELYPWDRFIVVVWKKNFDGNHTRIHLKTSKTHTIHLEDVKMFYSHHDYPKQHVIIHRIPPNSKRTKIPDYAERKAVGENITWKLTKVKTPDVMKEMNVTSDEGFAFWSDHGRNNGRFDPSKTDMPYEIVSSSKDAKDEFYSDCVATGYGFFDRYRRDYFVFTY